MNFHVQIHFHPRENKFHLQSTWKLNPSTWKSAPKLPFYMTPHVTLHGSPGLQSKRWSSIQTRGISRSIRSDPLKQANFTTIDMSQVESALLLMLMLLLLPSSGSRSKMPGEQSNAIAAVHPFLMKAPAATASIGAVRFSEFAFSPIEAAVGARAGRVFPIPRRVGPQAHQLFQQTRNWLVVRNIFDFPYNTWDNLSHWRIFFTGVETTNQETIKSFQRVHGLAGQSSRAHQGFLHAFDPWGLKVCIAATLSLFEILEKNSYCPVIQHGFSGKPLV